MSSIFGGTGGAAGGGQRQQGGGVLVQFNAGRCAMDSSNRVTPTPGKGTVSISKADGMTTFQWSNRESGEQDDPVLLFPGDVKFNKCKSAGEGRVFYLCFQNERREFFWMQNIDDAKDAENAAAVNAAINGEAPAAPGGGASAAQTTNEQLAAAGIDEEGLQVLQALSPEERQQMAMMLGLNPNSLGGGSASATPETPAPPATLPAVASETPATTDTPAAPPPVRAAASAGGSAVDSFDAGMLQSVLSGAGQQMQAAQAARPNASLGDVLSAEQVAPLLDNEAVVAALLPLLPEGEQTIAGLRANISSPQYQQALQSFDAALQSGDLEAAMGQFGVSPADVVEGGGGVLGLAHAMQKANKKDEKDDGASS